MHRTWWLPPGKEGIVLAAFVLLGPASAPAQPTHVETGTGTNICRLILNFPAGEKIIFAHRWNGASLNAKTLLEAVIASTGGELMVSENDYLTPFAMVPMVHPNTPGLVVHYQGSYEIPYINAIRWNGPDGPVGADYLFPDDWWHLWVRGPAHVDQSFAWPDALPPVDLALNSTWFFGEFSGLADLSLQDGATVGLVYGNDREPAVPAPVLHSVSTTAADNLLIRFSSVPGLRHQLETRTQLTSGNWSPAGEPFTATSDTTEITVPMNSPDGRGFYRIGSRP